MSYLLDTNIAIYAGAADPAVLAKITEHKRSLLISALVLSELYRGMHQNPVESAVRRQQLEILLRQIPVVPFDEKAAGAYDRIIAQVGWNRSRDYDRMIAAHAVSMSCVLVTNNEADFRGIPGLQIENWAEP